MIYNLNAKYFDKTTYALFLLAILLKKPKYYYTLFCLKIAHPIMKSLLLFCCF